jgi:CRISPR-associated protein (TIGR02710 family)
METPIRGAVITVGGSPEPIIKVLSWYPPEHVLFVVSEQSRGQIESIIVPALPYRPQYEIALMSNPDDLSSCYQDCRRQLEDWLRRWGLRGEETYFDYTGGTKTMSAALALAAVDLIPRYHYVGGKRDKEGLGQVISGMERSVAGINPWIRLGLKYRHVAAHFYENGQAEQAAVLLEEAAEVATDRTQTLTAMGALCRILARLDRLDVRNLSHELGRYQSTLLTLFEQQGNRQACEWLREFRDRLLALQRELEQEQTGQHPMALRELLACARRRARQGYYDDAIARLYRAVELFAQDRLAAAFGARLGIIRLDTLDPDTAARLREAFPTRLGEDGVSLKLGVRDCFRALEFSPRAEDRGSSALYDRLKPVLELRNQSWLAHGTRPASREDYERMWSAVLETLGIAEEEIPDWPPLRFDV